MNERLEGIKKDIAEIKFLIHDLRVESFINEIIHFHVTIDTDLEIYSVQQAQEIHREDLQELKSQAVEQRTAFQEYCNAVRSLSPDETVLAAGMKYIDTIQKICELILDPRWGRAQKVLSFLPEESRSHRSHLHYMNGIRWICGVHSRIEHFMEEKHHKDVYEEFDIAEEIQDYIRNVIFGYVDEKSGAKVQIQLDRLDPAVVGGNRYRFRRMFFNLVMNAVDAMREKRFGILNINEKVENGRAVLRVRDNGSGMSRQKIDQLLGEYKSLDGELHSLGFVFVRQTIEKFNADLSIESEVGRGTTITVSFPHLAGVAPAPQRRSDCEDFDLLHVLDDVRLKGRTAYAKKLADHDVDRYAACGEMLYADYMVSDAKPPGAIFAMGVSAKDKVDFFTHRPYERDWNITHEDLSPMLFEATIRGRLEEEDDKTPVLVLKAPLNVKEYFEFREVPESDRSAESYVDMIHDEYIRIARRLVDTGIPADLEVRVTDLQKYFSQHEELIETDPIALTVLADQKLNSERKEPKSNQRDLQRDADAQ
jgi:signal transduction histidine kinase